MTDRGFGRKFAVASSIRSLQLNQWDREPASGLISSGAWCAITTALSTSNRSPARPNFESGCRSRRSTGRSCAITKPFHVLVDETGSETVACGLLVIHALSRDVLL